jgi:hypothetical protein
MFYVLSNFIIYLSYQAVFWLYYAPKKNDFLLGEYHFFT